MCYMFVMFIVFVCLFVCFVERSSSNAASFTVICCMIPPEVCTPFA